MAKLLSRQQRVLLEHSEEIKKWPFIGRVIEEKIEITDKTKYSFSEKDQKVINSLPEIIKISELEWDGNPIPEIILDGDDRIKCSLCNTDNKFIFYIENRINNKKLNVGSRCINQFTILQNQGFNIKTIMREAEKKRNQMMIDKKIPGVRERINNWSKELDNFVIMIPDKVSHRYKMLGQEIDQLFNKVIKSNKDHNIKDFEKIIHDADNELIRIAEWVKEHKDDPGIVSKQIENWLKGHGRKHELRELKKTGYINVLTADLVTEPSFMKDVARKVSTLEEFSCSVNERTFEYRVIFRDFYDLPLEITPRFFMHCFGAYLYKNSNQMKTKILIEKGKLSNDRAVSSLINRSKDYLYGLNFIVESSDIEGKSIVIGSPNDDVYVEINLNTYIQKVKMLIFGFEPFNEKEFKHFILNRSQFTKGQLNSIRYVYTKGLSKKNIYEQ